MSRRWIKRLISGRILRIIDTSIYFYKNIFVIVSLTGAFAAQRIQCNWQSKRYENLILNYLKLDYLKKKKCIYANIEKNNETAK